MTNIRPINENKYGISKHRFRELYYFCLQYPEWQEELKHNTNTVGAIITDGLPHGSNTSDSTAILAARRADLRTKCEIIEETAIKADSELHEYILKAVTTERASFNYLKMRMGLPCERDMYYDRRRKFYWLLSHEV
ncbi:hypothetical protein Ami103574_04385 [Aminipila butyrica]|uniref:Uncharacterized protein n=1 Tax=Aminipila butyrica TaxID=433296 RepID=A0A858BV02_9FIRM|nr:hypothetical protein [Aminipila butyrica]QIB68604.1 hypothetical protein Ami103574_04385 [Aminipila butyrica]